MLLNNGDTLIYCHFVLFYPFSLIWLDFLHLVFDNCETDDLFVVIYFLMEHLNLTQASSCGHLSWMPSIYFSSLRQPYFSIPSNTIMLLPQ